MNTTLLTLVEDYAKIIDRLREDNERLRSLLKKVGLASETYKCLFCCRYGHDADCAAFTPDGEVK